MKKSKLAERLNTRMTETHDALTLLYTSLPPGQQRTVVKNDEVRVLFDRYGVEYVSGKEKLQPITKK